MCSEWPSVATSLQELFQSRGLAHVSRDEWSAVCANLDGGAAVERASAAPGWDGACRRPISEVLGQLEPEAGSPAASSRGLTAELQKWRDAAVAALPGVGAAAKRLKGDAWTFDGWLRSVLAAEDGTGSFADKLEARIIEELGIESDPDFTLHFLRCAPENAAAPMKQLLLRCGALDLLTCEMLAGAQRLKNSVTVGVGELNAKFTHNTAGLQPPLGSLVVSAGGFDDCLGPLDINLELERAMQREHCEGEDSDEWFSAPNYGTLTTSRIEWHFVVSPEEGPEQVGIESWPVEAKEKLPRKSKALRRKAKALKDFDHIVTETNRMLNELGEPELSTAEVIAARLYTGPMYEKYNVVLQGVHAESLQRLRKKHRELCMGNRYTNTIHALSSALVKLSKVLKPLKVYRRLNGGLPERWNSTEGRLRGWVQLSFLSTTADHAAAMKCPESSSGAECGIVLEINLGPSDRGADVSGLSQYPHEHEVLLPPWLGLEVADTRIEDSLLVLEVRLHWDFMPKTVEQVSRRKHKMVTDMCLELARDFRRDIKQKMEVLQKELTNDHDGAFWQQRSHAMCTLVDMNLQELTKGKEETLNERKVLADTLDVANKYVDHAMKVWDFELEHTALVPRPPRHVTSKDALEALLAEHQEGEELSLCGQAWVSDATMELLASANVKLTALDIRGCHQVTRRGLELVLAGCKQLLELRLPGGKHFQALLPAEHCQEECRATLFNVTMLDLGLCPGMTFQELHLYLLPNLRELRLGGCPRLTGEGVVRKLLAVENHPLEVLELVTSPPPTAEAFAALLRIYGSLRTVIFEGFLGIRGEILKVKEGVRAVVTDAVVQAAGNRMNPLRIMDLTGCPTVTDAALNAAVGCEYLNLMGNCQITGRAVAQLASSCPKLRTLNLEECSAVTDEALKALADHCKALEAASFKCNANITGHAVAELARGCVNLRILNLHYCSSVTDIALKALGKHCRGLEQLNLRWNTHISGHAVAQLACGCPKLRFLDVGGCPAVTDEALQALAAHCANLEEASFMFDGNISAEAVAQLASGCPKLRRLDLGGCSAVSDKALKALAEHCTALEETSFMFNSSISGEAVAQFAASCPNLRRLNLEECSAVTNEAATALAESGTDHLEYVNLSKTQVSWEGVGQLTVRFPSAEIQW